MADMSERTKDVGGLLDAAKFLRYCRGTEPHEVYEDHAKACEAAASRIEEAERERDEWLKELGTSSDVIVRLVADRDRYRRLYIAARGEHKAERDEAERLSREWVNQPPEDFAGIPLRPRAELLAFALHLYAKGLRETALERKDTVTCDDCAFRYGAEHTNADGSYSCPLCALERKDAALRGLPELLEWAAGQLDDGGDDGPSIRTAAELNAKAEELRALSQQPEEVVCEKD